jgi:hypothetical protein
MDHKQQHHEHHRHEREEHKKEQKLHEREQERKPSFPIHPTWLAVTAVVLILAAVLVWTFLLP